MVKVLVPTHINVDIPDTADGWELYAEPGAAAAALALRDAVVALIADTPLGVDSRLLYDAYLKHIVPVLTAHAALGANDTEPRWHVKDVLRRVYGPVVVNGAL